MIVVAIIGILAAIAIPAYQDYIARSQVGEAVVLLAGSKVPMAEFYNDKGRWPSAAASVIGTLQGKYVASVVMASGQGSTSSLVLRATMRTTGVSNIVSGDNLTMSTSDGGRNWDCYQGTILPRFRPQACQ
jgi:type IV pilus assembly protein PilA